MRRHKRLKPLSDRRRAGLAELDRITGLKLEECKGLCQRCGKRPDWRGLSRSHIQRKGKGGRDTSENVELWCGPCHDRWHDTEEYQWRKNEDGYLRDLHSDV